MIEKGNEIVRAPYLKAGDRVALVSPAYWVPEEVILQAAETLRAYSHIGACRIDFNIEGTQQTCQIEKAEAMLIE